MGDATSFDAGHLDTFTEVETLIPTILTTSKLLTTGVDIPTVKNNDYGKLFFNILDYTGSVTKLFADLYFDGAPVATMPVAIDAGGEEINTPSCFLRAKSTILSAVANKGTTTDTGENGFSD